MPPLFAHPGWAAAVDPAAHVVVRAVVHTGPPAVVGAPAYQAWMQATFAAPDTRHVFLHEDLCTPAVNFRAAAEGQASACFSSSLFVRAG